MKTWTLKALMVLTLMFSFAGPIVGEEALAPEPAAATAPADAGFLAKNIEAIVSFLGVLIALAMGSSVYQKHKERIDKITESKTWDIAKSVVTNVYHNYVAELKKGKADGKLTVDEARKARQMAADEIKTKAKDEGLKIAKSALPGLVELAVNFMKKKAGEAKKGG